MQEIYYPDGETVKYGYGYGGQITGVSGERKGTQFPYVKMIGYDEYAQRIFIEYGSEVKTHYSYDPYRRWLKHIKTESPLGNTYQDMEYTFDDVGNVEQYTNKAWGHTTSQSYGYDALYQLTSVSGNSKSHPWSPGGNVEYAADYTQTFEFSTIGNMTSKTSTGNVSNTNRIGADLNYNLDYAYYKGTHKAERIGSRYYDYDGNGNLIAEREGSHAVNPEVYRPFYQDGSLYWAEYGFGLVRPEGGKTEDGTYQRNYKWNERNLLSESSDGSYTVQYRYGADGQRALKFTANSGRSTVYFNKMWQASDVSADWLQGKHVYVGEDRIATKYNSEGNDNTQAEKERTYYYHSDHLGSAQTVTNWRGQVHERLEYTPYGELWIDWKSADAPEDSTPFRFTGKEQDQETGFYYYGARYLDPKTSRWLSGDPALGEYFPSAPVSDEARKRNESLPGMGGIFNTVNMHVYHYAGNNPVKYVDPDGEQQFPGLYGPRDYFDFLDFIGDPFARLLNLFRRADNGDQSAKTLLGMMWHEAGRDTLKEISDGSSIATLAFLAFGVPEGAAVASGVGLVADGLLVLDDIISGNYGDAIADGTILVAGIIIKKQVGKLVEGVGNRAVSISVGKNGRYYELGRRGALNTKDALRALVAADIANGIFGNLAPEVASQLLKEANKAIEEL